MNTTSRILGESEVTELEVLKSYAKIWKAFQDSSFSVEAFLQYSVPDDDDSHGQMFTSLDEFQLFIKEQEIVVYANSLEPPWYRGKIFVHCGDAEKPEALQRFKDTVNALQEEGDRPPTECYLVGYVFPIVNTREDTPDIAFCNTYLKPCVTGSTGQIVLRK